MNSVMQWQIISRDPEKHSAFYTEVFGWKINANNSLGYRMVEGEGGMAGGFWPAPPEANSFVQLFIEVGDIHEVMRKSNDNGGTVLIGPQTLPDGEQMAIFRDPMGLTFGVVKKG